MFTFLKNGYPVAMAFQQLIVEIQWLPLKKIGFLMLALFHPAAELLKDWATYGCPTQTGQPWTQKLMQAAVNRGPHCSVLSDDSIAHFTVEVDKKVKSGQAKLVMQDSIKENPPVELKISPIAAIPHKSKLFFSILDLLFHLRLKQGGIVPLVNAIIIKTAPKGTIPTRSFPHSNHSCLCGGRRTPASLWPSGT